MDEIWDLEERFWLAGIDKSALVFTTTGTTPLRSAIRRFTSGPIRIINMMQSLGGFMVLTWSATFLYSVCEQAWRE